MAQQKATVQTIELTSPAFSPQGEIPARYTCEGKDISPPLKWGSAPPGTKSFALVIDDPDAPDPRAPRMVWVHWVVYNIPPTVLGLAENSGTPPGAQAGINDWSRGKYGGPCPPVGRHRYFHKIYALDAELKLESPKKADLEQAMKGHILAQGELIGTYEKKGAGK
ncbi:MAG: YbhB/YbcL family Raf kinase inhibitor-like protein [Bdellovibrio sp.]|nr:MAG: YbhB/YbcL family Raf kinase inhibitor-like protein [Bdellovibrio sp.]